MQPISLKSGFLALTLVAIASTTGGLLWRGSSVSSHESKAPNATAQDHHGGMQDMRSGGGMHHSMAMDLGPADANYDLRFIDAMTVHHQGAVSMAKKAKQKSQRPQIKQLADNIIKSQNKEISQMQQWRQTWYAQASKEPVSYGGSGKSVSPMSEQQRQTMTMSNEDIGSADAEFDLRFINGMTTHHQGAVTMAQDALSKSKRPEVKKLAQEIVASQQAEINQLKQWRQVWYKK